MKRGVTANFPAELRVDYLLVEIPVVFNEVAAVLDSVVAPSFAAEPIFGDAMLFDMTLDRVDISPSQVFFAIRTGKPVSLCVLVLLGQMKVQKVQSEASLADFAFLNIEASRHFRKVKV